MAATLVSFIAVRIFVLCSVVLCCVVLCYRHGAPQVKSLMKSLVHLYGGIRLGAQISCNMLLPHVNRKRCQNRT